MWANGIKKECHYVCIDEYACLSMCLNGLAEYHYEGEREENVVGHVWYEM